MDSDIFEQEEALLRRELIRARKVMEAALEGWTEDTRAPTKEHQRLVEESNQCRETIKDQKAKLRDALRQLTAYENPPAHPARPPPPLGR